LLDYRYFFETFLIGLCGAGRRITQPCCAVIEGKPEKKKKEKKPTGKRGTKERKEENSSQ